MRCNRVRPLLSDYIDHELSFSIRCRIDEHLQECPECFTELQALERTVGMLSLLGSPRPIGSFWGSIQGRIESLPSQSLPSLRQPLVRSWVVVVAFLIGLGVFGSMIGFQWPAADPETEVYLIGEYARFQQAQPVADRGGMSLLVGESFRRQVDPTGP